MSDDTTTDESDKGSIGGFSIIDHTRARCGAELSNRAFRLFIVLNSYANKQGTCWPLRSTLADDLGWSERNVDRARIELEDAGLLKVSHRPKTSNLWHLTRGDRYVAPGPLGETDWSPQGDQSVAPDQTDWSPVGDRYVAPGETNRSHRRTPLKKTSEEDQAKSTIDNAASETEGAAVGGQTSPPPSATDEGRAESVDAPRNFEPDDLAAKIVADQDADLASLAATADLDDATLVERIATWDRSNLDHPRSLAASARASGLPLPTKLRAQIRRWLADHGVHATPETEAAERRAEAQAQAAAPPTPEEAQARADVLALLTARVTEASEQATADRDREITDAQARWEAERTPEAIAEREERVRRTRWAS